MQLQPPPQAPESLQFLVLPWAYNNKPLVLHGTEMGLETKLINFGTCRKCSSIISTYYNVIVHVTQSCVLLRPAKCLMMVLSHYLD